MTVHDTYSTEQASALLALGVDLVDEDPLRRIFSDKFPANQSVTHGLKRGGRVQYRLKEHSTTSKATSLELARTFCKETEEESDFDNNIEKLKELTKGTEAGQIVEKILKDLPHEAIKYVRAAFKWRNVLIEELASNKNIVELVLIKKEDGNIILHNAKAPADVLKNLYK
jgi:hypothetical protein